MKYPRCAYWITTGRLGSADNYKAIYSTHPNGDRALQKAIQDFANQTKREAWAELDHQFRQETAKKYYPKNPE